MAQHRSEDFDFRVVSCMNVRGRNLKKIPMNSCLIREIPCVEGKSMYVRIQGGYMSFGYLNNADPVLANQYFIKRKKARFYKVPTKIKTPISGKTKPTHVGFNLYTKTKNGHKYGGPTWHSAVKE